MATTDLRAATVLPPSATFGTHDHVPDHNALAEFVYANDPSPLTERTLAVHAAILLVGQRTPEEIALLADYLITGKIGEWRNG